MNAFWRYIFPVIFGLTIYASIRLVNDTNAGERFWTRPLSLNVIEVICVVATSYLIQWMLLYFLKRFAAQKNRDINKSRILKEFLIVFISCQIIVNSTVTTMAAITDDGLQLHDFVLINIVPALYVLLYFAIVRGNQYLRAYVENRVMLEKIENDHLNTELKLLRAQYHPHFLFNALNTVYFQMDEDIGAAKKSIEKFSGLLRYQLYDQHHKVPISQEIDFLRNYIELQKLRVSTQLELSVDFDPTLRDQQIYPLLLVPFVENAFKYVGGAYKMAVKATLNNGVFEYVVTNSIPSEIPIQFQGGIGLENLRRRLSLLYPGQHEFATSKDQFQHTAIIQLRLEELNPTSRYANEMYHN